jgi:transposase
MEGFAVALGKRRREQQEMWVATSSLPRNPGHVFYEKCNHQFADAGFDEFVEGLCRPHYADKKGRPGIPPGVYFRMIFVGYFEGIASQRGIAWRCSDSLSLRNFLGLAATDRTPDHSSLTRVSHRLPIEVFHKVFLFMLKVASENGLLRGKTVAVDATTLEANAAMKSIVRRDTGDDWQEYLRGLMKDELGVEDPSDEELRRFDKNRKNKKVSNDDWESETDPDSRIAKMKDGRTHLSYKAEHAVDLDTDLIVSAEIYPGDHGDRLTLEDTINQAQTNLDASDSEAEIEYVVADKG